jgi:hypothetical protein
MFSLTSSDRQKRERFAKSPIQLPLDFGEQLSKQEIHELGDLINKKAQAHKEDQAKEPRQLHAGRSPLPKYLPLEEIIIEPAEDTTGMVLMGHEVSDSLQYVPSRFYIQRIIHLNISRLPKSLTRPLVLPLLRCRSPGLANAWLAQGSLLRC